MADSMKQGTHQLFPLLTSPESHTLEKELWKELEHVLKGLLSIATGSRYPQKREAGLPVQEGSDRRGRQRGQRTYLFAALPLERLLLGTLDRS